ncbi:GntR family transcriptional regulator [Aquimarina algiphila]|uniref:GntR family transcriptional regulator n=1 Tax=Aquimarina algiphila TaxID=2047982 RepID=UPI00232B72D3|nr:GntR family transcriptional regulator [Aquimarina algiphila]
MKTYLQNKMLDGDIYFGARISLPSLAKELNVSVTPIREALTQLQHANIVEAIPNRGFFLPKLNEKEATEIYPIIASLEHLAISQSQYNEIDIDELKDIQTIIEQSTSPAAIVKYDLQFHEKLLCNFNNHVLHSILADLKIRVFMYEYHYMQSQELAMLSSNYHHRIIAFLSEKKIEKAANLVRESWLTSIDFIKNQFQNNHN